MVRNLVESYGLGGPLAIRLAVAKVLVAALRASRNEPLSPEETASAKILSKFLNERLQIVKTPLEITEQTVHSEKIRDFLHEAFAATRPVNGGFTNDPGLIEESLNCLKPLISGKKFTREHAARLRETLGRLQKG